MDSVIKRLFVDDWKRKLVALVGAIAVWLFVHQSITDTKTLPNVPIRLVNLPNDRTVQGLLPNGLLNKRVTLTVSGTKDVVDNLESSDLEVLIDASSVPDEWILQVTKKNLVSLDPDVDLLHHINTVSNNEFLIKMSRVITEKIPVLIGSPIGSAPEGYQLLDISPQTLLQTVTGPEEAVKHLQERGFQITFDLNQISKNQLDQLKGSSTSFRQDEVDFLVPDNWKMVQVPFQSEAPELINDPAAKDMLITFLRKSIIPIATELPVMIFYPVEYALTINPQTYSLTKNETIIEKNAINLLGFPLLAGEVSHLFLEVVKDNLELVIVAAPPEERELLQWSMEYINQRELEDTFVALLMSDRNEVGNQQKKEARLRRRFREYMQGMVLYKDKGQRLVLEAKLQNGTISVKDQSGSF